MLKWIIAPVVGGVIGYITNDLAIRMLFHPRNPVFIGKHQLPFTPGLIPKQKGRIAESIGKVISEQLLNEETLKQTILSDQAVEGLQAKVRDMVFELRYDERTVDELLAKHVGRETLEEKAQAAELYLTQLACERLAKARVGQAVVDSIAGRLSETIQQNRLLALLADGGMQSAIKAKLADWVDDMVAENAPEVVYKLLDENRVDLQKTRVCQIYDRFQDRQEDIIARGTELYKALLGNNVDKVLKAVNVEKIVVDKINGFDAAQLEGMIFGIMKRELNAIVYLGAALGFLMGFVNALF